MAKANKKVEDQQTEAGVAPEAGVEAAEAGDAEQKTDGRYKRLTDPDTGQLVNRVEYIRKLCTPVEEGGKGMTRSEATKEISRLAGEKIRYQIVFAATKNMKNIKPSERGKPKAAEETGETPVDVTEATPSE